MKKCRICLEGEKPNDPIIKRCDCKGCLVHNSCLEKWILLKKNTQCEICLKNFENLEIVTQFKQGPEIFQQLLPLYSGLFISPWTANLSPCTNSCPGAAPCESKLIDMPIPLDFLDLDFELDLLDASDFCVSASSVWVSVSSAITFST